MRDKVGEVAFLLVNEVVVNAKNASVEELEEFSNPILDPGEKSSLVEDIPHAKCPCKAKLQSRQDIQPRT